jgi:hypothetical protein
LNIFQFQENFKFKHVLILNNSQNLKQFSSSNKIQIQTILIFNVCHILNSCKFQTIFIWINYQIWTFFKIFKYFKEKLKDVIIEKGKTIESKKANYYLGRPNRMRRRAGAIRSRTGWRERLNRPQQCSRGNHCQQAIPSGLTHYLVRLLEISSTIFLTFVHELGCSLLVSTLVRGYQSSNTKFEEILNRSNIWIQTFFRIWDKFKFKQLSKRNKFWIRIFFQIWAKLN